MITHVIVKLDLPIEEKYWEDDDVFSNEYYGIGKPLIRCKDCKYSVDEYDDGECYCDYEKDLQYIKDWDHYCGRAERKEE